MEELVGSTWRNIHTGEGHVIHHLDVNRFGRPVLCAALPPEADEPYGQALEIVGFWSGDHYLVEEWVCVDLQSEETQLRWFRVELAWLSSQITFCENKMTEYRSDAINSGLYERVMKGHQSQLQATMTRMREFADQHRLCIPIEVLNSGPHDSDRAPAQMAMF